MSAVPETAEQFLVSFGKGGAVGVFNAPAPLVLPRGTSVVVQTARGTEMGAVLCSATVRQARLLGAASFGTLLRCTDAADAERQRSLTALGQAIFDAARAYAHREGFAAEVLDVDPLLDGRQAIVQYVGAAARLDELARALEAEFGVAIRLEDLAGPAAPEEPLGCGKPDCGKGEGGCTSCSTGGGCSSCGSSGVDLRPYFAHLREHMEAKDRTPLL